MDEAGRPRVEAPRGGASGEPAGRRMVEVDASAVRAVSDLLELLSELPSTPEAVAEVTRQRAGELAASLPPGGPAVHPQGALELEASTLVAAAALLQLLGQMDSTPPVVAEDARAWSVDLWERLAREPVPQVRDRG